MSTSPRAAAAQIIAAVKATMAAEWVTLKDEFEPDMQAETRKLVWSHVITGLLAMKAKEGS